LTWALRNGLLLVGVTPFVPQLIGSAFNIWYNVTHVEPLLSASQRAVFLQTITAYNLVVYPAALAVWLWVILGLRFPFRRIVRGLPVPAERLLRARRRVINLPWWGVTLGGGGWFLCIPAFLIALSLAPGTLDGRLLAHLPISFLISGLIAITHGFFAVELLSQRLLYPIFFRDARPANFPGTLALSLRGRGLLWALSAGFCPIVSLLLLMLAPHQHTEEEMPWFALAVGGVGIAFGMTTAWLVGILVREPLDELKRAAQRVASGDLSVQIGLLRADEFGPVIDELNRMVVELREKNRLKETLGTHVGQQAARRILARDPGLGGVEEEVTVVFVDIRNFTARSARSTPQQVVSLLNLFLTEMVEVVEERYGGMVNKFLGDGFMALFGSWDGGGSHADAAVAAGCEMLARLETINRRLERQGEAPLAIGIGIHTGRAVVGSLGSPQRMEYTAIGDTINIASRVEGLTKVVGSPLLITAATRSAMRSLVPCEELPPQLVKGQLEPLAVFKPLGRDLS
jgi:adenylate cyclase